MGIRYFAANKINLNMMMRRYRSSLLSLLLITLCYITGYAQPKPSFDHSKMVSYLQKLATYHKVMGSVAIDSAGKEVFSYSTGAKRLSTDSLIADAETEYRIGSVTKTFTATLIFQLIEANKLSLDTKLSTFYPDLPQADRISIQQLLSHRSGLFNFTNAPDYKSWMTNPHTKQQLLDIFKGQEAQFAPGSQTKYSNTNYVLLGFIIEELSGNSYADQLQKRITKPLGLIHTYYGNAIDNPDEAASFRFADSTWKAMPETDMSIPGGAGAIVSTPDDLTDFIRALFKGALVSQQSLDKMTRVQQRLGMGLMQIPFYDKIGYGHTGGIDGFQSMLAYFPNEDVALAFTGNGLNYSMNQAIIGMLSIYFGKEFSIPSFNTTSISLDKKEKEQYTGTYISNQLPIDIRIFIKDNALKAQATGQAAFPLTASDQTTLRYDPTGVVMEFDSLANKKYQHFILKQSGGEFRFNRNE